MSWFFLLWDVRANTRTRVPPVAAEGDASEEVCGRQRRPMRRSIFADVPNLNIDCAIKMSEDREL